MPYAAMQKPIARTCKIMIQIQKPHSSYTREEGGVKMDGWVQLEKG